jgi:hypothetical protein
MKNLQISLIIVGLLFVGCGGSSNSSNVSSKENKVVEKSTKMENEIQNSVVAKDTLVHDVVKKVGEYILKATVDKTIGEDDVSKDVISVHGTVNNQKALLLLNSNYPKGTKIVVEVYDSENNLVGVSSPKEYQADVVDFGSISIK